METVENESNCYCQKLKRLLFLKTCVFAQVFLFFIILFLLADFSRVSAGEANTDDQDVKQSSFYEIKRDFIVDRQDGLFITSFYEGEYALQQEKKFRIFKDIVSSHWNLNITLISQTDYKAGLVNDFDVIFYIKEEQEATPEDISRDLALVQGKKIILTGYNHDLVNKIIGSNLLAKEEIITNIEYKQVNFYEQNFVLLYNTSLLWDNKNITKFFGSTSNVKSTSTYPMAFLYDNKPLNNQTSTSTFLVMPFVIPSYYSINDYTVIFLDLLYEGLGGHTVPNIKPALLRLEDINVQTYYDTRKLRRVYNFLKNRQVPFHMAFIVRYVDPSKNLDLLPDHGRRFYDLISRMIGEGLGTLIQHGYTHQIDRSVSGIGFEFWDEKTNAPLSYESEAFVIDRIKGARLAMEKVGLPVPDIWETPHYMASEMADNIFNQAYPLRFEHIKGVGSLPFLVKIGETVFFPENLGFVSSDADQFVYGRSIKDIEKNLLFLSVFREPVASVFWHPWRDRNELKQLIDILQRNGYTFVSVYDLLTEAKPVSGHTGLMTFRQYFKPSLSYAIGNWLIFFIYFFFLLGCFFYLRTIFLLKRYRRVFDNFNKNLKELKQIFSKKNKKFPFFLIFVPARNEGLVIENTVRRLAELDYPKNSYRVVVIVDERELDDSVEKTTKEIVKRAGSEINNKYQIKLIDYVEVPKWYSGRYGDNSHNSQKSTKGRALNYALQSLQSDNVWAKTDLISVLDADGRLHVNSLKEAAYKRVVDNSKVLQGPVLQVSNFKNVNIVGIAAGIELAIHHLTELPNNLIGAKRVQFLAGTNYFIDKDLIASVGGWDQNALVEDAELALRIYIKAGIKTNWIGSPEIEQTPKNLKIYLKQRRRWVRGHLDLIKTIRAAEISLLDKALFFWKIFSSQFRFIPDLGFPILAWTFLFTGMFLDIGKEIALLSLVLLLFAVFIWDLYGHIYRLNANYIDPQMKIKEKFFVSLKLFFFSPLMMFIQSLPRILALIDYIRSAPTQWYKTERTREKTLS